VETSCVQLVLAMLTAIHLSDLEVILHDGVAMEEMPAPLRSCLGSSHFSQQLLRR